MRILSIAFIVIFCCSAHADTVVLKNGTRLEGDVKHADDGYDVVATDGHVTHISSGSVQSIQLGRSSAASADAAMDRLASLKRSVEQVDDLKQIIDRFQRFISQNRDSPAAVDAIKELATWQDRADQHMTKVGGKWVPPDQREQLLGAANDRAQDAYQLMKQNQLKESEAAIKKTLELDPQNVIALYLQGVLFYRQDKLAPARKAFEAVRVLLPSHGATLNNLAVIAWRQNQAINALGFYDEAMLAMPANKEIIGNVAEAQAALKEEFKKHPVAQRVARHFTEQAAQLDSIMAQYGWYPWGSTWLNQAQMDQLKKSEKDLKDKMDAMEKQFDELNAKFAANEDRMRADQRTMDEVSQSVLFVDSRTGIAYRNPLPEAYYQAQGEMIKLESDNLTITNQIQNLRDQAKRVEASKPAPKFTGTQQLIGVEGTPQLAALAVPATEPAMAPATPPPTATPPAIRQPTTDRVF